MLPADAVAHAGLALMAGAGVVMIGALVYALVEGCQERRRMNRWRRRTRNRRVRAARFRGM